MLKNCTTWLKTETGVKKKQGPKVKNPEGAFDRAVIASYEIFLQKLLI
jgi:hypothetical protein